MTDHDPRDHALRLLLEERLGDRRPPDLMDRIRSAVDAPTKDPGTRRATADRRHPPRRRRALRIRLRWWLVPALVLLGLATFVLLFEHSPPAQFIYTMF